MGFPTAQRVPPSTQALRFGIDTIVEGQFWREGSPLDTVFDAAAEAAEEAVLNALWAAETTTGRDGRVLHALPVAGARDPAAAPDLSR